MYIFKRRERAKHLDLRVVCCQEATDHDEGGKARDAHADLLGLERAGAVRECGSRQAPRQRTGAQHVISADLSVLRIEPPQSGNVCVPEH